MYVPRGFKERMTTEEMAAFLTLETQEKVSADDVRRICNEGALLDDNGTVGYYDFIAYMAAYVK